MAPLRSAACRPRGVCTAAAFAAVLAFAILAVPAPAAADVVVPDRTFDPLLPDHCIGGCSLRGAVLAANLAPGPDVVLLGAGTYRLAVPGRGENAGAGGDLDVHGDLTVIGAGADRTVIDAAGLDRAFEVHGGAVLTLHGVTVRGGDAGAGDGGVIAAGVGSRLVLSRVTIEGGRAGGDGGGIWSAGALSITDSTLAGNHAEQRGGGVAAHEAVEIAGSTLSDNHAHVTDGGAVWLATGAVLDLRSSTLCDNSAMARGGGLKADPGATAEVSGSILARNASWAGGPDCAGPVTSGGYNLIGAGHLCGDLADGAGGDRVGAVHAPLEAMLGPLAMNGGPTPTHAPLAGSPAIDYGDPAGGCGRTDQRGEPRPAALDPAGGPARCDVGAVEASARCVVGPGALCMADGRFRVSATWEVDPGAAPEPARAVQLTPDTGYFWFFRDANVEVVAKVLDACAGFGRWWVFASGLTDVGVTLTVDDLAEGRGRTYRNDRGAAFAPVQDTAAFPCL